MQQDYRPTWYIHHQDVPVLRILPMVLCVYITIKFKLLAGSSGARRNFFLRNKLSKRRGYFFFHTQVILVARSSVPQIKIPPRTMRDAHERTYNDPMFQEAQVQMYVCMYVFTVVSNPGRWPEELRVKTGTECGARTTKYYMSVEIVLRVFCPPRIGVVIFYPETSPPTFP